MDKDCDRWLEKALQGKTNPTDYDPYKIPDDPPKNSVEKLNKE